MRAALLTLALHSLLAFAQSWCPPGATWTYGLQTSWGVGYFELSYAGDTLLGGSIGKKINNRQHYYSYAGDSIVDGAAFYYTATRYEAGIVWWWRPDEATWDTLYWFDAVPGDGWRPPNADIVCPAFDRIEVIDTGEVIIQGATLRYLDVRQAGEYDTVYSRITERLGWEWEMNIWPPCLSTVADQALGLRCYSDEEISWSNPTWNFGCGSLVGVGERTGTDRMFPFPNPGTTYFSLTLPPGPHTITLFDATGRMVMQQRTPDARPVIATEALPAGLYRIAVRDEQGAVMGTTWVKAR